MTRCRTKTLQFAMAFSMALMFAGAGTPLQAADPSLAAASEAIKNKKHAAALKTMNKALKSGKLNTTDMSKALYYRGIAYRALKKPAQSIADLTNAIWLGGLTPAERVDALKHRAQAYQTGGLSGRAKSDTAEASRLARNVPKAGATSSSTGAKSSSWTTTAAKKSGGSSLTSGVSDFFGNIFGGSSKGTASTITASAPAVSSRPKAPARTAGIAKRTSTTTPGGNPVPSVRYKPKSATTPVTSGWATNVNQVAQKKVTSTPKSSGGGSSFFGNWFGGSSKPKPAPKAVPVTQPKVARPAVTSAKPTQTAALAVEKPAVQKPKRAVGRYKLQIATVRSRDEASSIVSKLSARHGNVVSKHPARIDEAVMGNMGTFYRVRLEAFASEKTALRTCNKLRASGLDCFPVAR